MTISSTSTATYRALDPPNERAHSLRLSNYVYACETDGHLVFLDLRNHRYSCLSRDHSRIAARIIQGLAEVDAGARSCAPHDTTAIINTLRSSGLVVESAKTGKPASPPAIEVPTDVLLQAHDDRPSAAVTPKHILRFFTACTLASAELRWSPIERIALRSQQRRNQANGAAVTTMEGARNIATIFNRLRPFYIRKYKCIFDSLALLRFLSSYHIHPYWVFGVRAAPFRAHCWLQKESTVWNDSVEFVREFKPILVI